MNQSFISSAICLSGFLFLISCSNSPSSQNQKPNADSSNNAYVPSTASAQYDPTKIDVNAPVIAVSLEAQGNSMDVMTFSMSEIRVKSGCTVKLHFMNSAKDTLLKHNFLIVKKGTAESVATAGMNAGIDKNYIPDNAADVLLSSQQLKAGKSEDLVFPAPPAGEYQFVCTVPGHWMRMNGKFIVE